MTPFLTAFDSVDPHKFMVGAPCVQDADLSEMFYRDIPAGEVNLPRRAEGVALGGDVVFSAYKRKEDRSGYVLRMYNPMEQVQETDVLFGESSIEAAWICNLNEKREEEMEYAGNALKNIGLLPHKILTLEVRLGSGEGGKAYHGCP